MLYVIENFPVNPLLLEKVSSGDTIIFADNAVYSIIKDNNTFKLMQSTLKHLNLCVRKADLLIRNISLNDIFQGITVLNDFDFIQDEIQETAVRSWN